MDIIKLTRGSKGANRFRAYRVFIDDEFVGKIKRKETLSFEVSEGKHKIQCKIDWQGSNELIIDSIKSPIHLMVNAKTAGESATRSLIPIDGRDKYLTLIQLDEQTN